MSYEVQWVKDDVENTLQLLFWKCGYFIEGNADLKITQGNVIHSYIQRSILKGKLQNTEGKCEQLFFENMLTVMAQAFLTHVSQEAGQISSLTTCKNHAKWQDQPYWWVPQGHMQAPVSGQSKIWDRGKDKGWSFREPCSSLCLYHPFKKRSLNL